MEIALEAWVRLTNFWVRLKVWPVKFNFNFFFLGSWNKEQVLRIYASAVSSTARDLKSMEVLLVSENYSFKDSLLFDLTVINYLSSHSN